MARRGSVTGGRRARTNQDGGVGTAPSTHPLADLFPPVVGDEFDALVEDIRAHGLRQPVVPYDGKVLDGRNRLRACEVAGVEPRYEVVDGTEDEALALVISLNLARRHLTTAQRAALAVPRCPARCQAPRRTCDGAEARALGQREGGARFQVPP